MNESPRKDYRELLRWKHLAQDYMLVLVPLEAGLPSFKRVSAHERERVLKALDEKIDIKQ